MLGGITVPPNPPYSPCQSHRLCCHDVPTGKAYRLSILSLSRLTPFVSLYTLHTLAQPFLLSRYYIVDNVIPALSGCPTAPRMTPCLYLCLPHSSSFLMVNGVGSCDMESA